MARHTMCRTALALLALLAISGLCAAARDLHHAHHAHQREPARGADSLVASLLERAHAVKQRHQQDLARPREDDEPELSDAEEEERNM